MSRTRDRSPRRLRAGLSLAAVLLALGVLLPQAAEALIPIGDGGGGGGWFPRTTTTRRVDPPPPPPPGPPRYKVEAVSFRADDESGTDWLGSDEPLWVFNSTAGDGQERAVSREFDDVDSGDTVSFGSLCLVADCVSGVVGPIALQTTLIETDLFGSDADTYAQYIKQLTAVACPYAGSYKAACIAAGAVAGQITAWLGDDLIKTTTISWPLTDLAPMTPGSSVQESVNLTDGDARYTFTFRTTRLS